MQFLTILLTTAVGSSHSFTTVNTNTAWGRTSLQMGKIIETERIHLRGLLWQRRSRRVRSYEILRPRDLPADIGSQKIFDLEAGAKIESHSHPASGQYFVAEGNVSVKTADESKEYKPGNMFITPADTEYTLEANDVPVVILELRLTI